MLAVRSVLIVERQSRLQELIAISISVEGGVRRASEPAMIERLEAPWLLAEAMPVTRLGSDFFSIAATVLLLTDLTMASEVDEARLRFAFSLTDAEARLAKQLASGKGLVAAAASLSISRETARSQLKAIFAKTKTERQAELASLISRISRPKPI